MRLSSDLAPSKKTFSKKKLSVGYVYIEESFDTIFNMDYGGGGGRCTPPTMDYGSGKSAMDERVIIDFDQFVTYKNFFKSYFGSKNLFT